jgi:hypothetical protein
MCGFRLTPTQTSVEDASIVEHNPIHSLTHGGPIEFLRLGSSTHYRDLSDMHLELKCRIKKNKNEDFDVKCKVSVINYLLYTILRQVDVFLGGKKINPSIATRVECKAHLYVF